MNSLTYLLNVIFTLWFFSLPCFSQKIYEVDFSNPKGYIIEKLKGYKLNKPIIVNNDIIFDNQSNFILKYKFKFRPKENQLFKVTYEIKFEGDNKKLFDFGFSKWNESAKCIMPEPNCVPINDEEHIKIPYIRLDTSKITSEWKMSSFFMLMKGDELFFVLRSTGIKINSNQNKIFIRNIKLEEIIYQEDLELIINGDFEYYFKCPYDYHGDSNEFLNWNIVHKKNWDCVDSRDIKKPTKTIGVTADILNKPIETYYLNVGSPDFQCSCTGLNEFDVPKAYSGIGYAKIYTGTKSKIIGTEFLQTEFTKEMKKGERYKISFYYRIAPFSELGNNRLGIRIGECPFSMDTQHLENISLSESTFMVSEEPNVSSNWQKAEFIYQAEGGEKFFTIGSFKSKREKFVKASDNFENKYYGDGWYLLDNVSVKKL